MIKGVTHVHLGPIWYHSEPSDVPYCPNQFLGWDSFNVSYSKPALDDAELFISFLENLVQSHLGPVAIPAN